MYAEIWTSPFYSVRANAIAIKMYIFIDESGDLGFDFIKKGKPSDFFVVGAIKISDEKFLNRVIKKHRKRLRKKKEAGKEVKFSNTSPPNRRRILEDMAELDLEIFFVYINKHRAYNHIKDDPVRMYSYLLKILVEKCFTSPINERTTVIFDRCFSKTQQGALELYLRTQNAYLFSSDKAEIIHMPSHESSGLLCADFICGAVAQKLLKNNSLYFDIIKNKVKCEKELF